MSLCPPSLLQAQEPGGDAPGHTQSQNAGTKDLYLEVFINGDSMKMIGAFKQLPDGALVARPEELREVGLEPNGKAAAPDGSIRIDRLPGVGYRIEAETQRLYFTTPDAGRAAKVIDINPEPDKERQKPQSSYGAVLNYSLFASTDNLMDGNVKPFQGISGGFDARFFSPYGTLSQSFTARYNWPVPADDRRGIACVSAL